MDPYARDLDGFLIEVDDQIAGCDDGLGMTFRAPDDGLNAGDELVPGRPAAPDPRTSILRPGPSARVNAAGQISGAQ
jgi:hypothetical protein